MEIEIRDCLPAIFAKILEFIYTGKVRLFFNAQSPSDLTPS